MTHSIARSLYRQQLFHWVGRDIEDKYSGQSAVRKKCRACRYLGHLAKSLESGLWVKKPKQSEEFRRQDWSKSLDMPIACFTEWGLVESRAHVAHYGRLGFGFPRSWVYKRGGQPVTYVSPAANSRYNIALQAVDEAASHWDPESRQYLDYILHFTKAVRGPRSLAANRKPISRRPRRDRVRARNPWLRSFGSPMPFVSEREWRIVIPKDTPDKEGYWVRAAPGSRARYYLPYKPGTDLFTLVLPDNLTMRMLLADGDLMSMLMSKDAPHVTLLSLEDVGTF